MTLRLAREEPRARSGRALRVQRGQASRGRSERAGGATTARGIAQAAVEARRELERLARPAGTFDARRYFRGAEDLGFHNIGAGQIRTLARSIHAAHRNDWSLDDAVAFAEWLIVDRHLETKAVGIELLVRYRGDFTPGLLVVWKRWLARNHAANWATTDAISVYLIGPLLVRYPPLGARMRTWAGDRNMWVRRAAAVSLIPPVRRGLPGDLSYDIARRLHGDKEDLIQKAVGWLLRENGKQDPARLERYLRANGPRIPRTTVRYAIERFPARTRRALLVETKSHGR